MDFVTKSFRKDETLTSLQHICPHFWAWLLNTIAITPKSEDKYVVKVFNWSEVHLSEMTFFLQNPYFKSNLKIFAISRPSASNFRKFFSTAVTIFYHSRTPFLSFLNPVLRCLNQNSQWFLDKLDKERKRLKDGKISRNYRLIAPW